MSKLGDYGSLTAATIANDDLVLMSQGGNVVSIRADELKEYLSPLGRYRVSAADSGALTNILVIGDSVPEGYSVGGGTLGAGWVDDAWPAKFLRLKQTQHGAGGIGYVNVSDAFFGLADNLWGTVYWTFSGGGAHSTGNAQTFGSKKYTPAANEVITLHLADSTGFTLNFAEGPLTNVGNFTVAIDGGAPSTVTVSTTGSERSTGTWSSATLAASAHTAVITPAAGKVAYVRGVLVDDGTRHLVLYPHALAGSTTTTFVAAGGMGTVAGLTNQLTVCANPALVIISLGLNDTVASLPAATFKTNMQTIIANIKSLCSITPSFVLISQYDISGTPSPYLTVLNEIATADRSVTVCNLGPSSGAIAMSDPYHPTTAGHVTLAGLVDAVVQ